jgi:hypothetical protein
MKQKWLQGDDFKAYEETFGLYTYANGQGATTYKQSYLKYDVISTDYDNYAVVYGCDTGPLGLYHNEVAWILTRKPYISEKLLQKAKDELYEAVYDTYDIDTNLVWSGEECGFAPCKYEDILDLSESLDEAVRTTKTISDLTHQIGSPQIDIVLEQFELISGSYCGLGYQLLFKDENNQWVDVKESVINAIVAFDGKTNKLTVRRLDDAHLEGNIFELKVVAHLLVDDSIRKSTTFNLEITPDCELQEVQVDAGQAMVALDYTVNGPQQFVQVASFSSSYPITCPIKVEVLFMDENYEWIPLEQSKIAEKISFNKRDSWLTIWPQSDNDHGERTYRLKARAEMPLSGSVKEQEFSYSVLPDCTVETILENHGKPVVPAFVYTVNEPAIEWVVERYESRFPKSCPLVFSMEFYVDNYIRWVPIERATAPYPLALTSFDAVARKITIERQRVNE